MNNNLDIKDKYLLERLKKDDKEAFRLIYVKHYGILYSYSYRYIKNKEDVEDIIQNVFVKFWDIRKELDISVNIRAYLLITVEHQTLNWIRNNGRSLRNNYKIVQMRGEYADDIDIFKLNEGKETSQELDNAISQLPVQQKKVMMLRRKGLSNKEIADILGLSLNTVNIHYRLGIKALRALLKDKLLSIIIVLLSMIH